MKKIILIAFLAMAVIGITAQDKKPDEEQAFSKTFPVEILTRIELNSELGIAPIFFNNKIYTQEKSGTLSCFDSTGKIVWKYKLSSETISRPVIADGQFVSGTSNGEIISIIAFTGKQIQSIGIEDSINTNLAALEYEGEKELFMPKQSGSKAAIIYGTKSGSIYCIDIETLQEYWRNHDSQGSVNSELLVVENKILFSGSDGYLYSIDARNGLLNWRWKETAGTDFSKTQIVCDGKKVFLVSNENQLYCIDLLLGKLIWKLGDSKFLSAIGLSKSRKELYAFTSDGKFFIISAEKGTVQKQIKRENEFDAAINAPIESEGKIYFTGNNSIFSINKKFREEIVLQFGEAIINSFQLIGDNKFLVSTSTGTILIFQPRK